MPKTFREFVGVLRDGLTSLQESKYSISDDEYVIARKIQEFLEETLPEVPGEELSEEESLVSQFDEVISDFENKRLGYLDATQRFYELKAQAHELGIDELEDEIQDYLNRISTMHEGKDLAGSNFSTTLRRLAKRKKTIQQEYASPEELRNAVNAHNDEIHRYLDQLSPSDPRADRLADVLISHNELYKFDD